MRECETDDVKKLKRIAEAALALRNAWADWLDFNGGTSTRDAHQRIRDAENALDDALGIEGDKRINKPEPEEEEEDA